MKRKAPVRRMARGTLVMLLSILPVVATRPAPALGLVVNFATGAYPAAIAIDSAGNVYTANCDSNTVSKITPGGGSTINFGNTGSCPSSIVIDSAGNIFTANRDDYTISKITPGGVSTVNFASTGSGPTAMTIDSAGNLYTADYYDDSISKITPAGVRTVITNQLTVYDIQSLAIDSAGNIYAAHGPTESILKITTGGVISTFATLSALSQPTALAIDSAGNFYTANSWSNTVSKITPSGSVTQTFATVGGFPHRITIDSAGNIYTANADDGTVSKITPAGASTVWKEIDGSYGSLLTAIAVDSRGIVYVANSGLNTVSQITPAPDAPKYVTGVGGNGQVAVSWTAPNNNGRASITAYTATANTGQTCGTTGILTCTITGLSNGTSYTFTVTATNSDGPSSASTTSSGVIPATTPGAPTNVSGVRGNGQVAVSWTAPTSTGGASITAYTATANTGQTCTTTGSLTCTIAGLENGTAYTFTVTATSTAGTSSASTTSSAASPATTPGAPTSVSSVRGNGQVAVSWTAPTSTGGASITAYTATANTGQTCGTTGLLTCTIAGLENGTAYTFIVTATNSAGTGSAATLSSPAAAANVPNAPTNIVASPVVGRKASVAFTAGNDNGRAINTHTALCASSSGTTRTASATSSPILVSDLSIGAAYSCSVTSTSSEGSSLASNASSAFLSSQHLSVSSVTGSGSVSDSSGTVNCSTECIDLGMIPDSTVILTATPLSGWTFSNWGGACSGSSTTCAVAMSQSRSVTAVFVSATATAPNTLPTTAISTFSMSSLVTLKKGSTTTQKALFTSLGISLKPSTKVTTTATPASVCLMKRTSLKAIKNGKCTVKTVVIATPLNLRVGATLSQKALFTSLGMSFTRSAKVTTTATTASVCSMKRTSLKAIKNGKCILGTKVSVATRQTVNFSLSLTISE